MSLKKQGKKSFWRQMWPYIGEYKRKLIITVVCAIIVGICVAVQPLVIKYIVDDGITSKSLSDLGKLRYVGIVCMLYLLLAVCRIFFWRIGLFNMLKSLEGSLFNLRSHFFSHVEEMCMRFHDSVSVGELFNCIMGTPMGNIKTYMNQIFINMPYQMISLIISMSALIYYDWLLTIILFLTAFIMAILNHFSRKKIKKVSSEYLSSEGYASRYINDVLHGMDSIKLYSVEDNIYKTFRDYISEMYEKGIRATFMQALENFKPEFAQYAGTAMVYFVGAVSCIYRGVSVGVLYAFLSSMGIILSFLTNWLSIGLQKSSAEAGLDRIIEVINTRTTTPEPEESKARSISIERNSAKASGKPCIEFDNVSFAYANKDIFTNFSCSVEYNESIALVGGSGSGKSTFSKLIMRLYDVNSGKVKIHGRDIKEYSLHDLRVSFGIVPQNPFIFHGSIWDNIRLAYPDTPNVDIIKAMEIAHVHEFVNDLPQGWHTVVGDGGLDLSGGQKQRIAIARAILGNPDILIFDEATSALDNISEKHIQEAMETLMKNHTVIIIAHRLSTIRNVDRIMVFNHGEIAEEGGYDELVSRNGMFSHLVSFNE